MKTPETPVVVGNRYKYINEGRKHLHTLDGKPLFGASTVKGIVGDKSNLYQYYADRAAISALSLPAHDLVEEYENIQAISDWRRKKTAMDAFVKANPDFAHARLAANRHRDGAAQTGTERHSRLEDYVRDCVAVGGVIEADEASWGPDVAKFSRWARENVEQFYFTEANCYSEPMWTGGIADLGLKLKDGRRLVGDHKSSKSAFPDQFLQCAIYDLLLTHSGGLDADGNKRFDWEPADGYVIFPFRSDPFTPEFRWNAEEWRKGAKFTAFLYKLTEIN